MVSRFTFPADHYPMTLRFLDMTTDVECWRKVISEPGPLVIPSVRDINGGKMVRVEATFATGRTECFPPRPNQP